MQRSFIALAVLATLGTSAFAQSNVTLYGRVNVTVERQKVGNGPNNWVQQNNASRFGLKGSEDLGGGLKAGFVLEHRFNINDGRATNAAFWGGAGQAEVNLGSSTFGTIRMGHMTSEAYYATADYVSMHNHDTGTSSDALYAFVDNSSNKVAYRSPSLGGLVLDAAVTAGDAPNGGRRTYDFAGNYDAGPLHLGAGYTKRKDTSAKQFAARALYELGPFVIGGYVQRDTDGYGAGFGDRTTYRLAGMYTMASTEFHLNYGHAGDYDRLAGDNKAKQFTVGVNQNLSKRTKVYTFYTKIDDNGAVYGDFKSFAVGVRHNF